MDHDANYAVLMTAKAEREVNGICFAFICETRIFTSSKLRMVKYILRNTNEPIVINVPNLIDPMHVVGNHDG